MIDSHAHIYSDKFRNDLDEVLSRTFDNGVDKILMPNIDSGSIERMLELEKAYPERCHSMMGLHPCSVDENFEKELETIEQWFKKRDFIAVGEMGIDLYWETRYFDQQKEAFRFQAALGRQYDLPLVIHTRNSMAETIELVEEAAQEGSRGVVHCFTGTLADAERIIETGFYLGIGGVATFKNGGSDKVLPHIPLESLVLETDSPYLAPVPHRGKRNEPSYIPLIAARIADICGVDVEEVSAKTDANVYRLFKELSQ